MSNVSVRHSCFLPNPGYKGELLDLPAPGEKNFASKIFVSGPLRNFLRRFMTDKIYVGVEWIFSEEPLGWHTVFEGLLRTRPIPFTELSAGWSGYNALTKTERKETDVSVSASISSTARNVSP